MNLISKLPESWRRSIVNLFSTSFDSAGSQPVRTSTVMFPWDSTREIRQWERREMIKKHRMLRNNLGFVRGMINTAVRLSIGWGLQPMPKSGNPDFDRRALAYYKRNTNKQDFDAAGQDHERSMQRLVLRETITDGEMFAVMMADERGRCQRQLVKTEQVMTPEDLAPEENWQDGILLNPLRRPLSYGMRESPLIGQQMTRARRISAAQMLHVFDRERALQSHGLPWGYTGLNHGIDTIDIGAFEKITHKLNTAIIGSINTRDGAAPANMEQLLLAAAKQAAAAGATIENGEVKNKEGQRAFKVQGSSIPIFKTGEGMTFFKGRNSATAIEFAGWLCAQYAQGFGMPVEFVVGLSTGGASVRGNSDIAGRFFEDCQMLVIDDWCQPNYENVIATGIMASQYPHDYPLVEPLDPPPGYTGWDACEWRGPRNITVDRGREGKLYLELKRAGWMSDEEYWTMNGEDPTEMSQNVDNELVARLERWREKTLSDGSKLPDEMFWRREFGQNLPANANVDPNEDPTQSGGN